MIAAYTVFSKEKGPQKATIPRPRQMIAAYKSFQKRKKRNYRQPQSLLAKELIHLKSSLCSVECNWHYMNNMIC